MNRVLHYFFHIAVYHKFLLAVSIAILVSLSIISSFTLDISNDLLDMLPRQIPEVEKLLFLIGNFGPEENVIILFKPTAGGSIANCIEMAQDVADKCGDSTLIDKIIFETGHFSEELIGFSLQHLFVLSTPEEQANILQNLAEDSIRKNLQQFRTALLMGATHNNMGTVYRSDPLKLSFQSIRHVIPTRWAETFDLQSGFFIATDESFLMMLIKPTHPPSDMNFNQELLTELQSNIMAVQADFPTVSTITTGTYAVMTESFFGLRQDLIISSLIALIGVILLYGLVYRRLVMLLLMVLSLGTGLQLTMGFIASVYGYLNVITALFPALLIGLGADFAIHFLERYFAGRDQNRSHEQALKDAMTKTGRGIVIAGTTTAIAFYSLVFTSYPAFRQLGIMAGTGILLMMGSVFTVTPLLLHLHEYLGFSRNKSEVKAVFSFSFLPKLFTGKYKVVFVLSLLISVLLCLPASRLRLSGHYLNIVQSTNNSAMDHLLELERHLDHAMNTIFVLFQSESLEQVLQSAEFWFQSLPGEIQERIEGISNLFPSQALQAKREDSFNMLMSHKGNAQDYYRALEKNLLDSVKDVGLNDNFFRTSYLPALEQAFACRRISEKSLPEVLKRDFLDHFLTHDGKVYSLVMKYYPQYSAFAGKAKDHVDPLYSREISASANISRETTVGVLQPSYYSIDRIMDQMQDLIVKDISLCLLVSVICIGLILGFTFRSLSDVLFSIVPVVIGFIWMLGTFKLLGGSLNSINIAIFPLIAGIGIDDGIHLIQRQREKGAAFSFSAFQACLKAVLLTSLTTMIGFAALTVVHTPGIVSLAYLGILGIAMCLLSSIVVFPALYLWIRGNNEES